VSRDPVAGVFVTTVSVISLLSYFCILAARAMETRVLLVDISASMGAVDLNIAKTALMSLVQQKMIQVSPHRLLLRCAKNWARGQVQRKSSSELNYAPLSAQRALMCLVFESLRVLRTLLSSVCHMCSTFCSCL